MFVVGASANRTKPNQTKPNRTEPEAGNVAEPRNVCVMQPNQRQFASSDADAGGDAALLFCCQCRSKQRPYLSVVVVDRSNFERRQPIRAGIACLLSALVICCIHLLSPPTDFPLRACDQQASRESAPSILLSFLHVDRTPNSELRPTGNSFRISASPFHCALLAARRSRSLANQLAAAESSGVIRDHRSQHFARPPAGVSPYLPDRSSTPLRLVNSTEPIGELAAT